MINLIIRLLNLKTDRLNTYLNLLCKIEETIQNKEYEKLIFQRQAEEDLIRFLSSLQKTESNFELLVSQEFLYSNKEIILLKDKIKSQYEQINKQYKNVQDQIIKVLPLIQNRIQSINRNKKPASPYVNTGKPAIIDITR